MQIRKLKLKNFRNFKNCEIEFSCDKNKNFTIVLGQNTFGKTTLVKSFIWCLYRINLFDNKILLNSDVAARMGPSDKETAMVEIELDHKGYTYKITTRENYCLNSSGNLAIQIKAYTSMIKVDGFNSITLSSSKADEEIENILRSDLKEYFFFDGETNSIESITAKKNLTSAVSNILGLTNIENLRDYFDPQKSDSVSSRLLKELIPTDVGSLDDLASKRDDFLEKKGLEENRKKNAIEEIERLKQQKDNEEKVLDANRDVEADQIEKKRLESQITECKSRKQPRMKGLIDSINSKEAFLKTLFAVSFEKNNFEALKEESSFKSGNSYVGITEAAVDQLIKDGKCICGAEIKSGNDAYNHLIAAREHMEPHDFGKYIDDFIGGESSNVFNAENITDSIEDCAKNVLDLIENIENDEQKLKIIKTRIEGRADVGEIQAKIRNIESQIMQKEIEVRNIDSFILPDIKSKLDDLDERIRKSSANDQRNAFTNRCLAYSTYIYKIATNKMVNSKKEIKDQLQAEVGDIFKSMYHGNRGIKIDDNFRAQTYVINDGKDQKIDGSTGLGTVMNYSFVAGLMNLAKKAIINQDDETSDPELVNETYPLVMDAPFSNTDETHIRNICNTLPNYCDQIIMFVMKKDFSYASDCIAERIGKMYELVQISETESTIKEVL